VIIEKVNEEEVRGNMWPGITGIEEKY